jgi:hypothetical protein
MAPKAKTAAKTRNGANKTEMILALLRRPKGCTRQDVLNTTKWKAVSLQQVAAACGVRLRVEKKERPYRYRAGG